MRETCTYGSTRGSRRKTAKSVLRVVEDRAGVPDNKGCPALLYTLFDMVWLRLKGWMNGGWEMRGRLERYYSPFGFFGCKMKRAVRLLTRGSFFSQRPIRK